MSCAYNDSLECLHLLLKKYADISIVDAQGQTPLIMAAKCGHTNIVGTYESPHEDL